MSFGSSKDPIRNGMASTWRKAKVALGFNLCVYVPRTLNDDEDDDDGGGEITGRCSGASTAAMSPPSSSYRALMPTTPTPTSSGLRVSKYGSTSSKRTCAICLGIMKAGRGHALFTSECSHTFHFHCIASNVKHGNKVCPICRAKWKEIPLLGPTNSDAPPRRVCVNPISWIQDDGYMNLLRRIPRTDSSTRHHLPSIFQVSEPDSYNDDEPVDFQAKNVTENQCIEALEIRTYPEFSSMPKMTTEENFTVLVHLKAPRAGTNIIPSRSTTISQTSRAPIDLVTVLDISGSMAGTKLALLKRAMSFVIQNLGPADRLSIVAFSSTARRLFHLRRMSETGRQQALQAVNALVSSGGTNIAEGLRKGAKVIEERKEKNPVCSIILLSDGQDTYTVSSSGGEARDYQSLLPSSIQMPVHAFGFGADHDSSSMHSISETSGGTFSFIEAEVVIQDAFAQCIGGLLSVVVQELRVNIRCVHPGVCLAPIKSGSYASQISENHRAGFIDVGDLYADEERDFLVSVNVPSASVSEIGLIKVSCTYRDPVSKESVSLEGEELRIKRTESVASRAMSIEVDRERNRIRAAEAMAEARAAAEQGLLSDAVSILGTRRRLISESLAGRSGDRLCLSLDAEIREMQERMESRQKYEASGRAYVLSGLSSHSWQRATARGDSTDGASLVHSYQTPSMVDMVNRSQTLSPPSWRHNPPIRPTKSSSSRVLEPRNTGPKDVNIKILYCGVCHSDIHFVRNEWGSSVYPMVPGHEIVGIVTEVGSEVLKFKIGDKAAVGCMVGGCDTCEDCTSGRESYCRDTILTYNYIYHDNTRTYGGYSEMIVVEEHYAIKFPDSLPMDSGAPLLCAGITVYSPLKYYGLDKPGLHVGVVGLGGLGHLAIKFAKAFGVKVTVISTSPRKKEEAIEKLGADVFLVSRDPEQMKAAIGTLDGIIDTVSAVHSLQPLIDLLKNHGKLIMVGAPDKPLELQVFPLLVGRKMVAGSATGGIQETQEMIDFAAAHNITADIELIPMKYINTAMERLVKADVQYRFVIDVANTLGA